MPDLDLAAIRNLAASPPQDQPFWRWWRWFSQMQEAVNRLCDALEREDRQQTRADGLATAAAIVLHELARDGQVQQHTRDLLASAVAAYEAGQAGQQ